jgi:hypothetical protein
MGDVAATARALLGFARIGWRRAGAEPGALAGTLLVDALILTIFGRSGRRRRSAK